MKLQPRPDPRAVEVPESLLRAAAAAEKRQFEALARILVKLDASERAIEGETAMNHDHE